MSILRIALLVTTLLPTLWAQSYSFQQFTVPGVPYAWATAINNRGAIVGTDGNQGNFKRDADGVFEFLIAGRHNPYFPFAINNSGVIGGAYYAVGNHSHGFLLTGGIHGTYTTVDVSPNPDTVIYGINNLGDFTGITGNFTAKPPWHGFVSIGGVITQFDVPGAYQTIATSVAWDGTVVGYYFDQTGVYGFVRGPKGNFLRFQVPNSVSNYPTGINNQAGVIVGYYGIYNSNSGEPQGFVYNYVADLAALDGVSANPVRSVSVQTVNCPGRQSTYVTGVNAKGVLVGYSLGINPTYSSFTATPLP